MDAFSDFDAQFDQTLALVNGTGESKNDPNQFKPSVGDKRSEYFATLRFIPPANGPMFVKKIVHFMKVGNKTVRVICPKTLDPRNQCDICSDNIQGHKSKIPALVQRAKDNGNKTRWVANVLVLEDTAKPENVGRVLWWEMPNQIMEYIEKLKNPPEPPNPRIPRSPSINAFHPTKGADFFLSMKMIDGYAKYDGSQFLTQDGPTPISEDINYINQVRAMCHDIQSQIVIPSQEEITDILAKSGAGANAGVQKSYSNLGNTGTPAPSVGGFASAPQQLDEFDAAYAQAGYAPAPAQAAQVASAPVQARPALGASQPTQKPTMALPGRPALQTPESVMPSATERVTPIPQAPAVNQPHVAPPVDDDEWCR
jgi:hypothetical protein